jgi:hypothetical protein
MCSSLCIPISTETGLCLIHSLKCFMKVWRPNYSGRRESSLGLSRAHGITQNADTFNLNFNCVAVA